MKETHIPSADSDNTIPVYVDAAKSNNPSNQSTALPTNHPGDAPDTIVVHLNNKKSPEIPLQSVYKMRNSLTPANLTHLTVPCNRTAMKMTTLLSNPQNLLSTLPWVPLDVA